MAIQAKKTVITLDGADLIQLQELLIDESPEGAVAFLRDVIGEKVRCAQAETHRTQFEGGEGKEGVHYLQKGEGHASPPGK
jgi:hypothetical protein